MKKTDLMILIDNVFNNPDGKLLLAKLDELYVKSPIFNNDHAMMAYLIGKRDIVLELIELSTENNEKNNQPQEYGNE